MIIFIFGDSITQGYWDTEGGWADRIKRYVMAADIQRGYKSYHGVFNMGIDANFTHNVLDRLTAEVNTRRTPEADASSNYGVIFAVGVNDSLHKNDTFLSTPAQYGIELKLLLKKVNNLGSRIAFVNLLPIDESAKDQATASADLYFTNDRIRLFNDILEQFCTVNRLTLIDSRSRFVHNYSLFAPDGVHPNTRGHEAIYDSLMPTIKTWLSTTR